MVTTFAQQTLKLNYYIENIQIVQLLDEKKLNTDNLFKPLNIKIDLVIYLVKLKFVYAQEKLDLIKKQIKSDNKRYNRDRKKI